MLQTYRILRYVYILHVPRIKCIFEHVKSSVSIVETSGHGVIRRRENLSCGFTPGSRFITRPRPLSCFATFHDHYITTGRFCCWCSFKRLNAVLFTNNRDEQDRVKSPNQPNFSTVTELVWLKCSSTMNFRFACIVLYWVFVILECIAFAGLKLQKLAIRRRVNALKMARVQSQPKVQDCQNFSTSRYKKKNMLIGARTLLSH